MVFVWLRWQCYSVRRFCHTLLVASLCWNCQFLYVRENGTMKLKCSFTNYFYQLLISLLLSGIWIQEKNIFRMSDLKSPPATKFILQQQNSFCCDSLWQHDSWNWHLPMGLLFFTGLYNDCVICTCSMSLSIHILNVILYCRCEWRGRPCHPDNFTEIYTDFGICYKFNSGEDGTYIHHAESAGNDGIAHIYSIYCHT